MYYFCVYLESISNDFHSANRQNRITDQPTPVKTTSLHCSPMTTRK